MRFLEVQIESERNLENIDVTQPCESNGQFWRDNNKEIVKRSFQEKFPRISCSLNEIERRKFPSFWLKNLELSFAKVVKSKRRIKIVDVVDRLSLFKGL